MVAISDMNVGCLRLLRCFKFSLSSLWLMACIPQTHLVRFTLEISFCLVHVSPLSHCCEKSPLINAVWRRKGLLAWFCSLMYSLRAYHFIKAEKLLLFALCLQSGRVNKQEVGLQLENTWDSLPPARLCIFKVPQPSQTAHRLGTSLCRVSSFIQTAVGTI